MPPQPPSRRLRALAGGAPSCSIERAELASNARNSLRLAAERLLPTGPGIRSVKISPMGIHCSRCRGREADAEGWLTCARCGHQSHRVCEGLPKGSLLGGALPCCAACALARSLELGRLSECARVRLEQLRRQGLQAQTDSTAAGTAANRNSHLAAYMRFARGLGVEACKALPLKGPMPPVLLEAFLVQLALDTGLRGGTFDQYVSTFNSWHAARGEAKPSNDTAFRSLVEGLRRQIGAKGRQVVRRMAALTLEQLRGMLADLRRIAQAAGDGSAKAFQAERDAAILALGFYGWLRAGEITAATVGCLKRSGGALKLQLRKSKTDPLCKGFEQIIPCSPASGVAVGAIVGKHLSNLRQRGLHDGTAALFPHVLYGKVQKRRMGPNVVTNVVRAGVDALNRQAAAAGKSGRLERKLFAGHSLRRGGCSHAFKHGLSREERQLLGRWRSDRSQDTYIEWCAEQRLNVVQRL